MKCPHCNREIEGMTTSECLMQTFEHPFTFSISPIKPSSELPEMPSGHAIAALNAHTALMEEGYQAMAEVNKEIVERFFPLAHDPSPEGLPDAPGLTGER